MARLLIPAVCYHCLGARVVYITARGTFKKSDFRPAELVQLSALSLLTEGECPICGGRGAVNVLVRD